MTQYVACTDDCCEDVSTVCESPEDAIAEWLSERLDQWRDRGTCDENCGDDCSHQPEEIDVHRIEHLVVVMPAKAAWNLLEDVDEWNQDRPEDFEEWPPRGRSEARDIFHDAIHAALLDYLEATTGRRDRPWWQAVESWVYVRGADGEYRRKP